MSVKTLSPQDIDPFYPVFSSVLKTEFPGYTPEVVQYLLTKIYNPTTLKYWLERHEKYTYVALHNDQIIGFALLDSPYGGVSFCRWLGVVKAYQRQGYGKALIHAWTEYAVKHKAHKMEVAGQPEAKEFYEKMGFDLEGFRKRSYFGIDQHLFGKVLSSPNEAVMVK